MSSYENPLKKYWLTGFCILVIIMISVGGVTRLTRSGLSIVEWKPISGIIPPLTEQDWQQQFELYKSSPEFNQVNSHFELSDYKNIFMWEYFHRVLGRLIFLFAAIPGFYLYKRKLVSGKFVMGLSALVAAQGLIGWLMVKSGLNTKPHVSPYMLALHFFSALSVLLVAYYQLMKMRPTLPVEKNSNKLIVSFGLLLVVQIFYGCLTSGFKAGYGYNTYPLMNGNFFPADGLFLNPVWLNFFDNTATIQWTHRWLAILTFIFLLITIRSFKKSKFWHQLKGPSFHLLGVAIIQIFLGILNIIYIVPTPLAALHQLVATFLVLAYAGIVFRKSINPAS